MLNPTLSGLVGGIQTVTLGDEEARRRGTQKTVLERKAPPTFDIMVEILDRERVAVHRDVAEMVDALLRGEIIPPEIRTRLADGSIHVELARNMPYGDGGLSARRDTGRRGYDDRGAYPGYRETPRRNMPAPRSPSMQRNRGQGGSPFNGLQPERRSPRGNGGGYGSGSGTAPFEREQAPEQGSGIGDQGPGLLETPIPTPASGYPRSPIPDQRPTPGRLSVAAHASENKPLQIYPFGVSRNRLDDAIKHLRVPATMVREMRDADIVLTLKNYYRKNPQTLRQAESEGVPVFVLKSNTQTQIEMALANVFDVQPSSTSTSTSASDPVTEAMEEAEAAITRVLETARPVELAPQTSYIRRLQHQMAERYNLGSTSKGKEPFRRVRIYRQD
jgi:hypothetical protein